MKQRNMLKKILLVAILLGIIIFLATISQATSSATIKVDTANLRETKSVDSKILELISKGEEVEILEQDGDWYQVKYKKITGYLRSDLVQVEETNVVDSGVEETNSEVVQTNSEVEQTSMENSETEEVTQVNENIQKEEGLSEVSELGTYQVKETTKLKITPLIMAIDIVEISNGQLVEVVDIINNWACIQYDGKNGWVRCEKIQKQESQDNQDTNTSTTSQTETEENQQDESQTSNQDQQEISQEEQNIEQETKKMYINAQTVNLRKEASTSSEIVTQLSLNTQVEIISEQNGWSQVQVDGKTGYVSTSLLSEKKQETSRGLDEARTVSDVTEQTEKQVDTENNTTTLSEQNSTSNVISSRGADVASYAQQFLGCSYVYGGTSPSGFDCSGFTYYVYKNFGVTLNRTAAGQYSNGTAVRKENLQVGDLVMFGSPIWHVGIYIGNGKIIHAANPSRGVTTDTIQSGYYSTNYTGARRIF